MPSGDAVTRSRFYLGLFLVTAATLMLQIIETRIISVTSWYHLAFFVISIAMFGLTAGAVWVYLRRETYTPARLSYDLTVASLWLALGTVLALLIQVTLATGLSASLTGLFVWTELAIAMAIPFFFSGVVVSLALTRSPYPIGKVYGFDLVGAAVGCLGVLALLDLTSGPSAVLWTAVLAAVAAVLFAGSGLGTVPPGKGLGRRLYRRRGFVLAGVLVLAIGNELTAHGIRPLFVKGQIETADQFAFERWNSFSRITATHEHDGWPAMWGPSPRIPADSRIGQRWLTIDGSAGTSLYRFKGDLEEVAFLRYDVTNLAYVIPGLETGAVIGVGGGRDVLSARLHGVGEVVGVELNPIFIDLLTREFADYTAIAGLPGVSFAVDEARSWFARTDRRFDIIQMSLIDTWAATGAGAFTLSENGLYTVEAWRMLLDRLNPAGVFTVSRWHADGEVNETGRMVSLAAAALMEIGVTAPERHLFLASAGRIATLVASRAPLAPEALAALTEAAARYEFRILLAPGREAASPILAGISTASDRAELHAAVADYRLDLTPPTDSRPFFFNQLRFDRLLTDRELISFEHPGVSEGNLVATITLAMLVLVSAGLVVATIVIPLRATVMDAGRRLAVGGTIYFMLIGMGFMMAEIALLQRMSVFLGHPVYALSVVLFSLILATGIGSLASERFPLDSPVRIIGWSALTAVYLLSLPMWLPAALLGLEAAGLLVRAGLCVLVLAPAGFLMGFGFPTGMRLVGRVDTGPTPWFWGINGAAGVLAASLAVFVSLAFGIDQTLRLGAVCYLLLPAPALLLAWLPMAGEAGAGGAAAVQA